MRILLAAALLGAALVAGAAAQQPTAGKPTFREAAWDELVPKDWNPLKPFKDMNLGMLSDGDPRATEMLKRLREVWDNAPSNAAMDGQAVRMPGYVVPLDDAQAGLKEFLLVPYFGACIHTPPPPANQIVHVTLAQPAKGLRSMDTVWVSGTLKTLRTDSFMGASSYRMEAVRVVPYEDAADKPK